MTIVTYRKGVMAADSQLNGEGVTWAYIKKIRKVKGWLLGAAGNLSTTQVFLERFDPECIPAGRYVPVHPTAGTKADMEALAVSPRGRIYYLEEDGVFVELKRTPFVSIGSGGDIAMAAMDIGANAVTAAKVACKYVHTCGGKVRKITLR